MSTNEQQQTQRRRRTPGEAFAAEAERQVGKPYVWGTAGPDTFDCSGLVAFAYHRVTGKAITRDSHGQGQRGVAVGQGDLRPGDLLFYDTANGAEVREGNRASHVGIYLGLKRMVNALNPGSGVVISDPFSPYFAPLYLGARRLFVDPEEPNDREERRQQRRAARRALRQERREERCRQWKVIS